MKFKYIFILGFIFSTECILGQSLPQFSYYGSYDLSSSLQSKNDTEEADNAELAALLGKIFEVSEKQQIELWYRVYEIEHTSEIRYNTTNDACLIFQCVDSVRTGLPVDFGTPLIANQRDENGQYRLRFASPVLIIDPALFSQNVESIQLPMNDNMEYRSSKNIDVSNLSSISGKDVIDSRFLIGKNKTLVIGALNGCPICEIPNSIETIGKGALRGAPVEKVIIPNSVSEISAFAFENCFDLKSLVINNENVIYISDKAFGETPLKDLSIYVPKVALKEYKKRYPSMKKSLKKIN